jgi:hypothetical protein
MQKTERTECEMLDTCNINVEKQSVKVVQVTGRYNPVQSQVHVFRRWSEDGECPQGKDVVRLQTHRVLTDLSPVSQ